MARQKGPIKGLIVATCDDRAESVTLVVEPVHLTPAEYDDLLIGAQNLEAEVITTEDHLYIELTPIAA